MELLVKKSLRTVVGFLGLALSIMPAFAAETGFWKCDGKFGLCRYLDRETGQEIIPARFEGGMRFSEGLAAVRSGGRFGYVDGRGEFIIAPKFDSAGPFFMGLAEVIIDRKAGIINKKGEIVVPLMFRRAVAVTSEVILAVETTSSGAAAMFGPNDTIFDLADPGLYHIAGYWIRKPDLKSARVFNRDGRGLIWVRERDSNLYGLLAGDGEWIIQPQYEYASDLWDGRAIVRKRVGNVVLSGAVDATGKLVVQLLPRALFYWHNGLGIAEEDGKRGPVDRNGNLIGGRYFDQVERADKGDISKVLIDGRWVGLDRAGNIVPNPDNGRIVASCPNGARAIAVDGKVQITDASGQPTAAYLFEPLVTTPTCDKPFSVGYNRLWGFVGVDGRLLFDPPSFKRQHEFQDGYAPVFDGQKWGVIDTSGRFALPPKFENYLERREGLFHVVDAGRDIWLTAAGEERPAPPWPRPAPGKLLDCGHGLKLVEREGLWGITEADGTDVIAPRYRALDCFRNGTSWAAIDSRRQWCALGPDGTLWDKPACRTQYYPSYQTHSLPEAFDSDPFESSVLWSRAYLEFAAGRRETPPRWDPERVPPKSTHTPRGAR